MNKVPILAQTGIANCLSAEGVGARCVETKGSAYDGAVVPRRLR